MTIDYKAFCIRDADWHAKKCEEAREASENDPETYYQESVRSACILYQSFPTLIKNSMNSDEWGKPLGEVPVLRNHWRDGGIAILNGAKGFIGVVFKIIENINKIINFRWFL